MNIRLLQVVVIIAVAILSIIEGRSIIADNSEVYGSELAGWYLIALGLMISLLGIGYFIKDKVVPVYIATADDQANFDKSMQFLPVLAVYVAAMPFLGYIISTCGFLLVYLKYFGRYGWKRVLILSISISAIFGIVFEQVGMNLPKGFLGF